MNPHQAILKRNEVCLIIMSIIIKPKHNVPTLYPKSQYPWETNASKTTYDRSSEIKCSF